MAEYKPIKFDGETKAKIGPKHSVYLATIKGHMELSGHHEKKYKKALSKLKQAYRDIAFTNRPSVRFLERDMTGQKGIKDRHDDNAMHSMLDAIDNTLAYNNLWLYGDEHDIRKTVKTAFEESWGTGKSVQGMFKDIMMELWDNGHIIKVRE